MALARELSRTEQLSRELRNMDRKIEELLERGERGELSSAELDSLSKLTQAANEIEQEIFREV